MHTTSQPSRNTPSPPNSNAGYSSQALNGSNSSPHRGTTSGMPGDVVRDSTISSQHYAVALSTTDAEQVGARLDVLRLGNSTVAPTTQQPTPSARSSPANTLPSGPDIAFSPEDFGLTQDALPPYSEQPPTTPPIPIQQQQQDQQHLPGGSVGRAPSTASSISAHSPRNPFVPSADNAPPSPSYAPPLPRRPSSSPTPATASNANNSSTNPFGALTSTSSASASTRTSTTNNISNNNSSSTARTTGPRKDDETHTEYVLKPIDWIDPATGIEKRIKIITQNENGPCPLLALCNTLILQGKVEIKPYDRPSIRYDHLLGLLAEYLLVEGDLENPSTSPTSGRTGARVEAERQRSRYEVESALRILPRLEHGLDVNVFFKSIRGFENTPELGLFHSFGVELVHGWIVNPEMDPAMYKLVDGPAQISSYNKAVECIVKGDDIGGGWVVEGSSANGSFAGGGRSNNQHHGGDTFGAADDSARSEQISHALTVQEFLNSTSTQLTHYGLNVLHESLPEGHLCAFFRNNHFCTLFKNPMDGILYTLVTDQSLAHELAIVWESLDDVDGAGNFLDGLFRKGALEVGDYARSTQPAGQGSGHDGGIGGSGGGDEDFALALQLQQQEEEEAERQRRAQQQGQNPDPSGRNQQSSALSTAPRPSLGIVPLPAPGPYQAYQAYPPQRPPSSQQSQSQTPYPIPAGAGPLNTMALDPYTFRQETDEEMAQRLNREFHQEYLREQQQQQNRQQQPLSQVPPQQQQQLPPQMYQAPAVNGRHSYDPTRRTSPSQGQHGANGRQQGRQRYSSDGSGSGSGGSSHQKEKCVIM